jgi:hypothetical protein
MKALGPSRDSQAFSPTAPCFRAPPGGACRAKHGRSNNLWDNVLEPMDSGLTMAPGEE